MIFKKHDESRNRGVTKSGSFGFGVLLGTASAIVLAGATPAAAAGAPAMAIITITGSLIAGTEAVGVPVGTVGAEEFRESASITVSDVLRDIPNVEVISGTAHGASGANLAKNQRVNIHGQDGSRTLVLVDGMRIPLTGVYADGYDPSIISPLALSRVDTLANGASATYGSDAVGGVVNMIMLRDYDGATSQVSYSHSDVGGSIFQASQLFGRTFERGGVTVAMEHTRETPVDSIERDYITWDFTPWGLDDRRTLRSSLPATVSAGNAALPNRNVNPIGHAGSGCTNCFLIPSGQNGVGLVWANLSPMTPRTPTQDGVNNIIDPHRYSEYMGRQERTLASLTFDYDLTDWASLFVDAYYLNRHNNLHASPAVGPWAGGTISNLPVSTNNPYRPIGAPANLRVSYSTVLELDLQHKARSISARWAGGFNLTLPWDWRGKAFYAIAEEKNEARIVNTANVNNISAALGNIVGDLDGKIAPYMVGTAPYNLTAGDIATNPSLKRYTVGTAVRVISPDQVPFLNLFCDPTAFTCNDPRTLDFIRAHWIDDVFYQTQHWGTVFDGPLFALPGGEVQAAVGADYVLSTMRAEADRNQGLASAELRVPVTDYQKRGAWSVFGQLNVPLFSEMNAIPGLSELTLEGSLRYDRYDDFGGTTNYTLALDWMPFNTGILDGLSFSGSYGTSFAAPAFRQLGVLANKNTRPANLAAGGESNVNRLCTTDQIMGASAPTSGSVAAAIIGSIGAANCSDAAITAALGGLAANHPYFGFTLDQIRFPGILNENGGAARAYGTTRPSDGFLSPETSFNMSVTASYTPTYDFLAGLTVSATWWKLIVHDYLDMGALPGDALNDALPRTLAVVRGDDANNPGIPFDQALTVFLNSPGIASGATPATISILTDQMFNNRHRQEESGIDFNARYDWDMANWGAWHLGVAGSYRLCSKVQVFEDSPESDTCDPTVANAWGVIGNTEAPRTRARARLGWVGMGGWDATLFMNYQSHYFSGESPPPDGVLTYVSTGAYMPVLTGDDLTAARQRTAHVPAQHTFDVSVGYNTGNTLANTYLHDIEIRLTVNNLMDRRPPFFYKVSGGGAGPVAIPPTRYSAIQRVISLALTKVW